MGIRKIKSPEYLGFLSNKRCVITGEDWIDIHHESLLSDFRGGMKKYNDFQAIPIAKRLHIYGRHDLGKEKFWSTYGINPYEAAITLIEEYLSYGPEDFDLASEQLEKLELEKYRWEFSEDVTKRYKDL